MSAEPTGFVLRAVANGEDGPAQPIEGACCASHRALVHDADGALWVGELGEGTRIGSGFIKVRVLFRGVAVRGPWHARLAEDNEVVLARERDLLRGALPNDDDDNDDVPLRLVAALDENASCASRCALERVAVGDVGGGVVLVPATARRRAHDTETTAVDLVSSEHVVVVSGAVGSVKVWVLVQTALELARELRIGLCSPCRLLAVSGASDSFLVIAGREGSLAVWTTAPRLVSLNDDTTAPLVDVCLVDDLLFAADAAGTTRRYAFDYDDGTTRFVSSTASAPVANFVDGARAVCRDGTVADFLGKEKKSAQEAPLVQQEESDDGPIPPPEEELEPSPELEEEEYPEKLEDDEDAPDDEAFGKDEEEEEPRLVVPMASARPEPPTTDLVRPSRVGSASPYATAAAPDRDDLKADLECARAAVVATDFDHTRDKLDRAIAAQHLPPALELPLESLDAHLPQRKRLVPKQVDPNWLHRLDALRPQPCDFNIPDAFPVSRMTLPLKPLDVHPLTSHLDFPALRLRTFEAPLRLSPEDFF